MYARGIAFAIVMAVLPLGAALAQSDDGAVAYQVAAEHYHRQRWKLAAEEFDAFLKEYPDHRLAVGAEFFAGEAALQAGDMSDAFGHYQRYLESGGSQYENVARFRSGETAYLLGEAETARQQLTQFIADHPSDSMGGYALTYLGNLALDREEPNDAVGYFGAAIRRFEDEAFADECRYGLAKAYQSLGQLEDAQRFFTFLENSPKFRESAQLQLAVIQMESDLEAASETLSKLRQSAKSDEVATQATYWLGILASRQEKWSEAARLLTSIELDDDALGASAAYTAADALRRINDASGEEAELRKIAEQWPDSKWGDDALLALAKLAAKGERWAKLDHYLTEFQKHHPNSELRPAIGRIYGRAALTQRLFAAAARSFEQTPQQLRTPSDWYHLALARLAIREDEEALVALDRVEAEPGSPLQAATLLATATALVRQERFEPAVPIMARYLTINSAGPESDRCRAQLTIALASLGRWQDARSAYESMTESSAAEYWSTTQFMAEGAAARGEHDWARELYLQMAANGPDAETKASGLAGIAWVAVETETADSLDESAEAARRLLEKHPDHPMTRKVVLRRAQALRNRGDKEQAIVAFELYLRRYGDQADSATTRLELAELYDHSDRDEEAREQLESVLASPELESQDQARYLLGWVYHDLERYEDSLTQFRWIVEKATDSRLWPDAAYRLAEHAAKTQQLTVADSLAKQITDRNESTSTTAHAWYLQGQLAAKRKRWAMVHVNMNRVLSIAEAQDLYVPARFWIAESLYRRRKYEEAETAFLTLRRLTNGRKDAWLGMLSLRQAQILAYKKNWREAYGLAEQIRNDHPQFAQMHEVDYLIGRCHGSWADFAAAREAYQRVVTSRVAAGTETAAMAQWMIGETYLLQRDYEKAIRAYHRVLNAPRWQAAALLQAAKCHEALKQPKPALQLLNQLLNEYPESEYAADAKARRTRLLNAPEVASRRR